MEGWFALRCENDYEGRHFLIRLAKTLIKHDVYKQPCSNFKQHTEFSGSLYSVANNAGKVDRNYEL